jgi:hypothetical protein
VLPGFGVGRYPLRRRREELIGVGRYTSRCPTSWSRSTSGDARGVDPACEKITFAPHFQQGVIREGGASLTEFLSAFRGETFIALLWVQGGRRFFTLRKGEASRRRDESVYLILL